MNEAFTFKMIASQDQIGEDVFTVKFTGDLIRSLAGRTFTIVNIGAYHEEKIGVEEQFTVNCFNVEVLERSQEV